jgi:hypothetical protein
VFEEKQNLEKWDRGGDDDIRIRVLALEDFDVPLDWSSSVKEESAGFVALPSKSKMTPPDQTTGF